MPMQCNCQGSTRLQPFNFADIDDLKVNFQGRKVKSLNVLVSYEASEGSSEPFFGRREAMPKRMK